MSTFNWSAMAPHVFMSIWALSFFLGLALGATWTELIVKAKLDRVAKQRHELAQEREEWEELRTSQEHWSACQRRGNSLAA